MVSPLDARTAHPAPSELDPLPSVLPPEGVVVARLASIAARSDARIDVADVRGAADAALVAAMVRSPNAPPVVVVTEDADGARRLGEDSAFFLGRSSGGDDDDDSGDVLVLTSSESSPYADVNPDRRAAMNRMATLSHLATGR